MRWPFPTAYPNGKGNAHIQRDLLEGCVRAVDERDAGCREHGEWWVVEMQEGREARRRSTGEKAHPFGNLE